MPERASYNHGTPNWVDVQTTDQDAAKAFYSDLFGWTFDDQQMGEGADAAVYSMAVLNGGLVGAIAPQSPEMKEAGAPAMWNTYIAVDDVDHSAEMVTKAGGNVLMPPFDVVDAGRMAVATDPAGSVFLLWQAKEHIGATIVNEPGAFIWSELITADPDTALPFYAEVLGHETDAIEMDGTPYTMLKAGGEVFGGSAPPPMEGVPNHWHVWFAVESVPETVAKATAGGGAVLHGPETSSIGETATLADPQGAVFSIIAPRPPTEGGEPPAE